MKRTVSGIERAVDKAYDGLNGVELANLVSTKLLQLPFATRRGENEKAELLKELEHIAIRYVRRLSYPELDKYRVKRYEHDTHLYFEMYLRDKFELLCRQDDLLAMLLLQLEMRWLEEIENCPSDEIGTTEWTQKRTSLLDLIQSLRSYQQQMRKDAEEIKNASCWKDWKTLPPEFPDDQLEEQFKPFFDGMDELRNMK